MFRITVTAGLLFVFSFAVFSQTVTVPEGVVYKTTSDQVNQTAQSTLKKELSKESPYALFSGMLLIGPGLWSSVKDTPPVSNIQAGNTTYQVPITNKKGKVVRYEKLSGKLIQKADDYKIFLDFFKTPFESGNFTFRKLNPEELQSYWAVISWDIEEPVYILESDNKRYLFDLEFSDGKYSILWIDLLN